MINEDKGYQLIEKSEENRELLLKKDKCDKYDYLIAAACGALGGLIDIFFVGTPGDSALGRWTDKQTDRAVMGFARKMGWNPKEGNADNVNSAIGFLEHGKSSGTPNAVQGCKVKYDQRPPGDVGNAFNIAPGTHHMMSLAHSPDIVGLFFSILNQFTSTSSFIAEGRLVTVASGTYELQGGNFIMRIMCGVANWFGHLMSDVAGSSGSHGRGTGIVVPFYELFGLCKFGSFSAGGERKDLAEIAMQAFQKGYDFRFGMAQAIPVAVTELSIRLIWALRRHFQYHYPLKECVPTMKHADLRIMLIIGNGTLCAMDAIDAGIRSGGSFLAFFMRLNLIAWFRFVFLVLKEVCIRVGLSGALEKLIEAYKRINEALLEYLHELEKLDIERFKKETEEYNRVAAVFDSAKNDNELNAMLLETFERMGLNKPWEGDFDEHMSNKNATLVFE